MYHIKNGSIIHYLSKTDSGLELLLEISDIASLIDSDYTKVEKIINNINILRTVTESSMTIETYIWYIRQRLYEEYLYKDTHTRRRKHMETGDKINTEVLGSYDEILNQLDKWDENTDENNSK